MSDTVFVRRVLSAVGLVALAALAGVLVIVGIDVLLLAFAGVLFALFLRGLAHVVERYGGLGRPAALAVVVGGLVTLLATAGWFIAPPLADQAAGLAEELPHAITRLRDQLQQSRWGRTLLSYAPEPRNVARAISGGLGGTVAATLGWVVGGTANVAVVLFIGLYVAAAPGVYRRGLLRLVPARARPRTHAVLDDLGSTLQRWLLGKVVGMVIIGVLTSIGLSLVGVPLALALGVLAGVLNFVPYLGPVLSFVPAALLAVTQSPSMLAWVLALYVVIQGLESYVVTPLVQQEAVALPPALILTAQVLFGVTVGWLGLLLATPLTAGIVVVLRHVYLGNDAAAPGVRRAHDAAA